MKDQKSLSFSRGYSVNVWLGLSRWDTETFRSILDHDQFDFATLISTRHQKPPSHSGLAKVHAETLSLLSVQHAIAKPIYYKTTFRFLKLKFVLPNPG